MTVAAAPGPAGSFGRPSGPKSSPALWKLTVSRTVTAWTSAKTGRRCSTARRPPEMPPYETKPTGLACHWG